MNAVLLLLAAFVALALGGFVQLDDTSGFGSDDWVMPLGVLAAAFAGTALVVALRDRSQRRPLGTALGCVMAAVIVLHVKDDGFRFVWHSNEGELFLFEVFGCWVALALVATGGAAPPEPAPADNQRAHSLHGFLLRAVAYLGGTALAMFTAFSVGMSHYESEGDLAAVGAFGWAALALLGCLGVIVTIELYRATHRW